MDILLVVVTDIVVEEVSVVRTGVIKDVLIVVNGVVF